MPGHDRTAHRGSVPTRTVAVLLLTGVAGCAPSMTPLQEKAWDAFKDCQQLAPTAQLTELTPDGRFGFMTRESTEFTTMKRCLEERYGYRFSN